MIPQLRFPEFTDEWQLKKFGDIGKVAMCKRIFNSETSSAGDVPFYKIGTFGRTPDAFIKQSLYDEYKNKYPFPNQGDILLSAAGTIGRMVVYDGEPAYFQDSNIIWLKHDNSTADNKFLKHIYSKMKWITESGTIQRLYNDNFLKTKITIPSTPEQQKIADFLGGVDSKLTSTQTKVAAMHEYKKGVMQALFSGKLRFRDENGNPYPDWEEKRLGDITSRVTQKNGDNSIHNVLTNSATAGIVNQSDYFDKDIANQNNLTGYYVVSKDDFVYNPRISQSAPVGPIKRNNLEKGVMSPLYTVFRFKDGNKLFFEMYFNTKHWHEYMRSVANSGARHDRMNITTGDFYNLPVPFPCSGEQQKIADFLSALDDKIKLEESKLASSKEFKKALLQRMFV